MAKTRDLGNGVALVRMGKGRDGEDLWAPVLTEEDLERMVEVGKENDRLDRERAKAWKKEVTDK